MFNGELSHDDEAQLLAYGIALAKKIIADEKTKSDKDQLRLCG